ncbi:MAG: transcriptional repressor [Bdellovibrionota bacterium]
MDRDWTFLPRQQDESTVVYLDVLTDVELKKIIRSLNLKATHQRMAILRTLQEGRRHVTAQELYEILSTKDSSIGFATVYRFLRNLTDHNFVTEVRMGRAPARYELNLQKHHDHLTCTACGKICEFENKSIENLQIKVAQQFGFRLTHHVLELFGVCSSCQMHEQKIKFKK